MAGISAVGTSASLQTQLLAAAVRREQDALELQGDFAPHLIQSATLDPAVGNNLDVHA